MSSENKAIKVSTDGSTSSGLVTLYPSDSQFTMRLPGVPTEIRYELPDGMEFGYELYFKYSRMLEPQFDQIEKKFGKEGFAVYKKYRSSLVKRLYKDSGDIGDAEFKEDVSELIEHFTTLLKAKLIEFVATKHEATVAEMEKNMLEVKAELEHIIETGVENVHVEDDE
jgi:hypothetical protein